MTGKKANFLTDNLGWLFLALLLATILILAFPYISKAFEKSIAVLRNLI